MTAGDALTPRAPQSPGGVRQAAASVLFDLWLYGSMAVMGVALAPAAIWSRNGAYWAMKLYVGQALWVLRRLCGVAVELRGAPPTGEVVVAAKHQSFLDILILFQALDRPVFVMKRSLAWAPILGLYALRIGAAPVDRRAGGRAVRAMTKRLGDSGSETPRQIVIYPQGTRVAPGAAAPYRPGVAALAATAGRCAPVATNAGCFWGRRSVLKRPGRAVVTFLPEIPVDEPRRAFMARLESAVETASEALRREAEGEA